MTDDYASIDFETRAVFSLFDAGVHRYVQDPWFRPMCLGWAINEEPVQLWKWGEKPPRDLIRHIERGGMLHAWNAQFERVVWWNSLVKLGWPKPSYEQFRCTMVRSIAGGFPSSLRWGAIAMKLTERKDDDGAKAMSKLSRPRNLSKIKKDPTIKPIWWEPEGHGPLHTKMWAYCEQDVVTEREAGHHLPMLIESEERQYWYDQKVADRGIRLDKELCRKAIKVVEARRIELNARCVQLSGLTPTQNVALLRWVNKQGFNIPNLQKLTLKKLFSDDILKDRAKTEKEEHALEVLRIRQEASKTSTAKYETALDCVCADGTLKGQRQFYGAHTGRWAGRLVQLDNLMRPTMDRDMDEIVSVIKSGHSDLVHSAYDNVMDPVANAVRGMLVADEGEDLYVGDYKSIESRMAGLMSGHKKKLEQWKMSDEGKGPDVYVVNAAQWFNVSLKEAAHKDKRFWGKTGELLLTYEGGTAPLLRQQVQTDIRFRDIYEILRKNADGRMREKVSWLWKEKGASSLRGEFGDSGVNEKDWRAARFVVELWRQDNQPIVKLWKNMKDISVKAVMNPGKRYAVPGPENGRRIIFEYSKDEERLRMFLMSGRPLCYPFAHVVTGKNAKGKPEHQLRAYYQNSHQQWVKYSPYGGFLTENADQAQSRDVMASRFRPLEDVGFRLRHTVHDEIISSAKKGSSLKTFIGTATVVPAWASGLPLALDGWSGPRYRKKD